MNNKIKLALIALNLLILFLYFNYAVFQKEKTLESGNLLLFELAPADPRSLMQGDYMQLSYAIVAQQRFLSDSVYQKMAKRGYCVVQKDSLGVAQNPRFQAEKTPHAANEFLVKYKISDYRNISIGAEAYFFQEGQAAKYDSTRYGGIKIDGEGNSILVGLYDRNRKKLGE